MAKINKRASGRFIAFPFSVLKSEMGRSLTAIELKLLLHLMLQYNGNNNGNLSPTFMLMKEYGWSSTGTLYKARQGLEHKGFIVVTRQGHKRKGDCTLVAITWNGIDDAKKKPYDDHIKVSPVPLNYFTVPKDTWAIQPSTKPPEISG
jgi:hypothetical protein